MSPMAAHGIAQQGLEIIHVHAAALIIIQTELAFNYLFICSSWVIYIDCTHLHYDLKDCHMLHLANAKAIS